MVCRKPGVHLVRSQIKQGRQGGERGAGRKILCGSQRTRIQKQREEIIETEGKKAGRFVKPEKWHQHKKTSLRGIVDRRKCLCCGLERMWPPHQRLICEGTGTQCAVLGWGSGRCEQTHEYTRLINGLIHRRIHTEWTTRK